VKEWKAAHLSDCPVLYRQVGKSFKVSIRGKHDEFMKSRERCEHDVYLRQGASLPAQLEVHLTVQPRGTDEYGLLTPGPAAPR
jgi:hypothetical protein